MESESVKMTVEVLNDGKGNKAFRALNIKCWDLDYRMKNRLLR